MAVLPEKLILCRPAQNKLFEFLMSNNLFLLFFHLMLMEMYIDGKLVDSCFLTVDKIYDAGEREAYIQGAAKSLLEKWEDLIEDQELEPEFFIKGQFNF